MGSASGLLALGGVIIALAACGAASTPTPFPDCKGGQYCVSLVLVGHMNGYMTSAQAPSNFRAICAEPPTPPKPTKTWLAHLFGSYGGSTWLISVQSATYQGPGTYPATISLGKLAGTSVVSAPETYFGSGTATVKADAASAQISAKLALKSGQNAVSVSGTVSCIQVTPSS